MKETIPVVIGLSRDQRTNRWKVVCPKCGQVFSPSPTMLSYQALDCVNRKCATKMVADYNSEPPVVRLSQES